MPQLISVGNRLFRIAPSKNRLEVSFTGGTVWVGRGWIRKDTLWKDLLFFHGRLFVLTNHGIWISANEGADWVRRGSGQIVDHLVALMDGGQNLLALHENGIMYRSYNEGADWVSVG